MLEGTQSNDYYERNMKYASSINGGSGNHLSYEERGDRLSSSSIKRRSVLDQRQHVKEFTDSHSSR